MTANAPASTITVNTTKAPTPASAPTPFPPPKTDKPRPHVCATCQRSFARLEHLKRHERSHTKEKPFECPECARCFARRDLLLRHQQKLHQSTTPSSRPRNRRESTSSAATAQSRARKNSVAGTNVAATAAAAAASNNGAMRPRANTISHVDPNHVQMIAAANASVARSQHMPAAHHARHQSLVGLPIQNMDNHPFAGMSSVMGHRGMGHGLPKLETHGMHTMDFNAGLRTAPPLAFQNEFEFEQLLFGQQGSTINPNALHYTESPHSMSIDHASPFGNGMTDMSTSQHVDDSFDWLTGFENGMSFSNNQHENAVGGSSPSAMSTTSQSGISDVMLDGSNNTTMPAATSSIWQPTLMGPPQIGNPFSMDSLGGVFPDLLNGAPVSPQPPGQKTMNDVYFSTPPSSMNSMSPSVMPGLTQNMNHALNFGSSRETTTSMGGGHQSHSPVATIIDATRNAIIAALSQCTVMNNNRRYSFTSPSSPLSPRIQPNPDGLLDVAKNLPSTQDLQRYVGSYLQYCHPHLPFLHIPTLSFDTPPTTIGRTSTSGGSGCLILSMAAIGALYELERPQSRELFEMAKKMIQLYLEERRKADMRKADFRRTSASDQGTQGSDSFVHTPLWLVQAMLLNVVYGHNCGDKTANDIASTHSAALVSLAQAAGLLRPLHLDSPELREVQVNDAEGNWSGGMKSETEEQAEWLRWKTMEERKRTLYIIFILSSLLVTAYNHAPALTNSEILLDLPCDEEFFAAESAAAFNLKGGARAANHNRMTFHEALGELLLTNEKQQKLAFSNSQTFGPTVGLHDISKSELKPSTLGCLVLINALHNYIWETRQRHHNRVWTNEETEKMHRHIEPALKAWQSAWASNPHHSLERPNPFGMGPLSADAIPLLDLAYVRLFVNMARTKEKFWQRDWEGLAEELSRGAEIIQHAEHSPASNAESITDPSDASATSSVFVDSPPTQSSSPEFSAVKFPSALSTQPQSQSPSSSRVISRREKHLRKAAFYAADSLSMSDKLGVTFAEFTSRELPVQSAMCSFDCAQVLAEWISTLQDRVGRYLGILGKDEVDLTAIPAVMLLEEEDMKLIVKVQELLASAEMKLNIDLVNGTLNGAFDPQLQLDVMGGYAAKILRVTACMLDKSAVWPGKSSCYV